MSKNVFAHQKFTQIEWHKQITWQSFGGLSIGVLKIGGCQAQWWGACGSPTVKKQ